MQTQAAAPGRKRRIYPHLYVQVLCAIAIGVLLGHFYPSLGAQMKPLGDMFIQAIKMVIAPIIFCTVVHGIASMEDMKKVGRVGLKAIVYFEVVTTLALVVGLVVANLWQPGAGMNVDPATIDAKAIQQYAAKAHEQSAIDYVTHIIPASVVGAFAEGEILQVLFFSLLFAFALSFLGETGKPLLQIIDLVGRGMFGIVAIIMRAAPLGAFGAMAFTIGKYGVGTLLSLGHLMASVYATCLIFIFIVLGGIAGACGFSILKFIRYIKEELLIVLGTSSSESVLPRMIAKLENLGCSKSLVGMVLPAGYTFNLDGSSVYLTMGALFIAQATNTHLTFGQELLVLALCLITSKGAATVVGSAFITLAATLSSMKTIPVEGMVLILGVDWFMAQARAMTNMVGNGVATIVLARWENEFDAGRAERVLNEHVVEPPKEVPATHMPGTPAEAIRDLEHLR